VPELNNIIHQPPSHQPQFVFFTPVFHPQISNRGTLVPSEAENCSQVTDYKIVTTTIPFENEFGTVATSTENKGLVG